MNRINTLLRSRATIELFRQHRDASQPGGSIYAYNLTMRGRNYAIQSAEKAQATYEKALLRAELDEQGNPILVLT